MQNSSESYFPALPFCLLSLQNNVSSHTSPQASRGALRKLVPSLAVVLALQFLTAAGFTDVDLAVDPTEAEPYVRVYGASEYDYLGSSVSNAGDVNLDDYSDFLVGAPIAGFTYLIFGRAGRTNSTIDTASLTRDMGIKIMGPTTSSDFGGSVSSLGDLNWDGYGDFIIGAPYFDPLSRSYAGGALVIFGKATASWADIDTSTDVPAAGVGYWIYGAVANDKAGWSVGGAGDVNGDGNLDIIVGAYGVYRNGASKVGCAYVIFGQGTATTATTNIDLASFTSSSTNGFRVYGTNSDEFCGSSVSGAGDVNIDGYDDVLVGCWGTAYSGKSQAGSVFVLFGHSSATPYIDLYLTTMTTAYGFVIYGPNSYSFLGEAVGKAGYVNGDWIEDFVVGANQATVSGRYNCGAAYVIFGRTSGFSDIDLASFTSGSAGFRVIGAAAGDNLGRSVAGGASMNGDGIDDVVVGARGGEYGPGVSYVILGHSSSYTFTDIDTANLTSAQGSKILGAALGDRSGNSVALVPDFNGDWVADVLIGARYADSLLRPNAGAAYLLYGSVAPYCPLGSVAGPDSGTCIACPVDTYADHEGATDCKNCRYLTGTVGTGNSQCDTVQVGLPDEFAYVLFGVLGGIMLCCLATQAASLTAAVVGMVLVSTLDLLTDLVYIVSAKFVTGAVFGLCVAFFLLRAAPFLYRLYEMGHWYPCFRASFYTMPAWAAAGEGSLVTAALVLGMVLVYPLYLPCHLVFAVVWLLVGCFLHLTGLMALQRVKEVWVQVWRGEWTVAFSAPAATQVAATPALPGAGTDLMVLAMFVALPEIILQLYNQEKVRYTAIGIVSVIASGLVILSGIAAAASAAGKHTPIVPGAVGDEGRAGDYELTAFVDPQAKPAAASDAPAVVAANGAEQQIV